MDPARKNSHVAACACSVVAVAGVAQLLCCRALWGGSEGCAGSGRHGTTRTRQLRSENCGCSKSCCVVTKLCSVLAKSGCSNVINDDECQNQNMLAFARVPGAGVHAPHHVADNGRAKDTRGGVNM